MHPLKALAPGSQALDLRLVTKSEPGQMKQEEWKPAHIKGSFTLGDPGCNVSCSMRAKPAPQSCHCWRPRDGGHGTSASSGPARARSAPAGQGVLPAVQLCSTGHCKTAPKILRKLRWKQQGNLGRSHGLLHSRTLRAETDLGMESRNCNSRALLFSAWTEPKSIAFKLDSDKTLGGSALPAASCQSQPGTAHMQLTRWLEHGAFLLLCPAQGGADK